MSVQAAPESDALRPPVKSLLADYESIEHALARDSMDGVADKARAISQAVRQDQGRTMSLTVAEKDDKLAQARDLKSARTAFQPLSQSFIDYLDANNVKSTGLKWVYRPMAKASWLQKGEQIRNLYMGKSMSTCGEVQQTY